jgi:16S rRNA (guanine527-N7)-methyltransferase
MISADLEKGLLEVNMTLSSDCIQSFERFAFELKKWNRKMNLTAISKDSDIAVKHFVDSLFFTSCINCNDNVMDIGSGAGIPAIPLKIVKPKTRVISVDAVGKKIMFQRHVARMLGLEDFEALHARVETIQSNYAGFFDVISSRAFSRLDTFVALAAPMLKNGGRMIAMKGPDVQSELYETKGSLYTLGFEITSVQNYSLPLNKGGRSLITISAVNAHK